MSGGVPAGEGLGDLPSRIQGWIGKARARGGDRIELDFATVELLVRVARRATPTPPIEGRDADVERVLRRNLGTMEVQRRRCQEWGMSHAELDHAVRETRAALQALGERP